MSNSVRAIALSVSVLWAVSVCLAQTATPPGQTTPPAAGASSDQAAPPAQKSSAAATKEVYTEIPGSRVSLHIPDGFSVAKDFPGLVQQELNIIVIINQTSGPFSEAKSAVTEKGLADQGATLLRTEDVSVSGMTGVLLHVTQKEDDGTLRKWILLFGNDSMTVMVAASAPQELEASLGEKLTQVLLTAEFDPDKKIDEFYGLGFTMRESELLEIRARVPGGVLMTRKDAPDDLTPDDPVLVVFPVDSVAVAPLDVFAKEQLTNTQQFVDFANVDGQAVSINGASGYRIIADAKAADSKAPVRIYLVALRSGGKEMVLEGVVATGGWDQYLPEFRGMTESFRLTEDSGNEEFSQ